MTIKEIYNDKKFVRWVVKNKYIVFYYKDVTPIYLNENDPEDTAEMGRNCYTIEEIYKTYDEHNRTKR